MFYQKLLTDFLKEKGKLVVNKAYKKGYQAELEAKKHLIEAGYSVIRSAGSKGPIDLVCWDINGFRLIQVKNLEGKMTPYQEIRDLEILKDTMPTNCRVEIWFKKRKKFDKRVV